MIDQTCLHTFTQHITVQYNEYSFIDIPVPYFVFSSMLLNAASLTVSVFSALSLEYLQHWELTIRDACTNSCVPFCKRHLNNLLHLEIFFWWVFLSSFSRLYFLHVGAESCGFRWRCPRPSQTFDPGFFYIKNEILSLLYDGGVFGFGFFFWTEMLCTLQQHM